SGATETIKPSLRGDYEISRKTIAQGMPECFGQPVVTTLVCFHFSHTRLRVRPSARHSLRPLLSEGERMTINSGRSCRGSKGACLTSLRSTVSAHSLIR